MRMFSGSLVLGVSSSSAFGDYDLIKKAYEIAVEEEYNFGAYGDAMLII